MEENIITVTEANEIIKGDKIYDENNDEIIEINNGKTDMKTIEESKDDCINGEDIKKDVDEKLPKKAKLLKSIKELASRMSYELPSQRELNRMKIEELKKLMANMISQSMPNISNLPKMSDNMDEVVTESIEVKTMSDAMATTALYNLHILLFKFMENTTETFKDVLPITLSGLTQKAITRETDLKETIKVLLKEYGTDIKQYLSPTAVYFMFISSLVGECAIENVKKKNSGSE
jgi:hypothetical protein